jgi:hypothetical protein
MSGGVFYVAAGVGVGFAAAVAVVGMRALRQSKTVEVFEQPKQTYMLQVNPPSTKVQTLGLPARRAPGTKLRQEKQA